MTKALPAGQRAINHLPRFGLTKFANRIPDAPKEVTIDIGGDVLESVTLTTHFEGLDRLDVVSDFHCVTTWTKRNVNWSGYSFTDFYEKLVLTLARPMPSAKFVVFKGQDGYRVGMRLEDLLAPGVLLADSLEGQLLPLAHGAPLRLVAPEHYGYKCAKHITRIEFWCKEHAYQPAAFKFMDHPRACVEYEERGTVVPGWVLRWLYRPLIKSTERKFEEGLAAHLSASEKVRDLS